MLPAHWWSWLPSVFWTVFLFMVGGCVGSFLNVVAYRLPRGEGLFRPGSRCPNCQTPLTWRENFPIFGWLTLRGRCRYCKASISPQYPAVEFLVAALFAWLFFAWYGETWTGSAFGGSLRPEWAEAGLAATWPFFALVLVLVSSLVAMTLIDARTFMIPLSIPWFATGCALVTHAAMGLFAPSLHGWPIPIPESGTMVGLALGGALGVGVANALVLSRMIPRSFADFERWAAEAEAERQSREDQQSAMGASAPDVLETSPALGPLLFRVLLLTGPAIAGMALGFAIGLRTGSPHVIAGLGAGVGLLIGVVARRLAPDPGGSDADPAWIQYPYARREAAKEILFLAPIALLAWGGAYLGPLVVGDDPAIWLRALSGALVGYLVGGGIVWGVRLLGTFAFGKEAMGLGDVHLLAAVGAALGWIDPVLAFFTAPFFGIAWAIGSWALRRGKGVGTAMPYGPHLAAATLFILLARPFYDAGLAVLLPGPTP